MPATEGAEIETIRTCQREGCGSAAEKGTDHECCLSSEESENMHEPEVDAEIGEQKMEEEWSATGPLFPAVPAADEKSPQPPVVGSVAPPLEAFHDAMASMGLAIFPIDANTIRTLATATCVAAPTHVQQPSAAAKAKPAAKRPSSRDCAN